MRLTRSFSSRMTRKMGRSSSSVNADEHLRIVALSEIVDIDESVVQVADLPMGWQAVRSDLVGQWVGRRRVEE